MFLLEFNGHKLWTGVCQSIDAQESTVYHVMSPLIDFIN